jgi:hypothetical protein
MDRGGRLACASTFDFGVGPTRLICIRAGGKERKSKGGRGKGENMAGT